MGLLIQGGKTYAVNLKRICHTAFVVTKNLRSTLHVGITC